MIRLATHYRCTVPEVEARFSAYELREMEIAEELVPYGERAATLRMQYLGHVIVAALAGSRAAQTAAERIRHRLEGTSPTRQRNPVAAALGRLGREGTRP